MNPASRHRAAARAGRLAARAPWPALALAALLAAAGACKSTEESRFELILVTSPPAVGQSCPTSGAGGLLKTGPDGVRTIRLTVYDASGPPGVDTLICDRLLAADESGTPFYVAAQAGQRLTYQADAFGDPVTPGAPPRLIARGWHRNLPFSTAQNRPRILMVLTDRLACGVAQLALPRAFHSTTALPGSRALVAGGVVASNAGATATVDEGVGLFLTDQLEIYDGNTGTFVRPVVSGDPGTARAFHTAVLLPGSTATEARVLLVGGVARGDTPSGTGPVQVRSGPAQPFRLSPTEDATAAPAELLVIDLAAEPPTVDRQTTAVAAWRGRFLHAATADTSGNPIVAGGAWNMSAGGAFTTVGETEIADVSTGAPQSVTGSLITPRIAASLTPLGDDTALVWGGNLSDPTPTDTVAELLGLAPPPPISNPLLRDLGGSTTVPISTAFHTATLLPGGGVLIGGGFAVIGGQALNPDPSLVLTRVEVDANQFRTHAQDAGALVAAGYHAALALPDGTVLITGGSPAFVIGSVDCPDGDRAWTCSLDQAVVYTPGATPTDPGATTPYGTPLQVSRFGHTMTLLDDGTVVVVGGLHRDTGGLRTEGSLELTGTSTGDASGDPLARAPGDLLSIDSECPTF